MIELQQISKVFQTHTGQEYRAVDDLSLHVKRGEIYGLLGPNGAGKTTTLRMFAGLMEPSSGAIRIEGLSGEDPLILKERVGFLTASSGLYARLSGRETLHYFGELRGMSRVAILKQIDELSGLLKLEGFIDRRCEGLSTGEKQRVQIARTLMGNPPVLILDEPTNGLDVLSNRLIISFIRQAGASGRTIIVSTHHLDEVESVCHRFGLLHKGRLLAEGNLAELQTLSGQTRLSDIFLALVLRAEGSLSSDGMTFEAPELASIPPLVDPVPAPQNSTPSISTAEAKEE